MQFRTFRLFRRARLTSSISSIAQPRLDAGDLLLLAVHDLYDAETATRNPLPCLNQLS